MAEDRGEELVEVARYAAFDAGMQADLAVNLLESSGLRAVRFPGQVGMVFDGALSNTQPIRVLVPAEEAGPARELLAEVAQAATEAAHDPAQWVVAATFQGEQQEMEADLAVTTLCGAGLPARRSPELPTTVAGDNLRGIAVLVPPGRRSEARDLLVDQLPLPGKSTPLERWLLRALLAVTALGTLCFALEIGGAWGILGYTVRDWTRGTFYEEHLQVVTHYWPAVMMGLMMLLWFAWMAARGRQGPGRL